jgi:hypothetical protein
MAIYMSGVKTFPWAKGARVTRTAAYRAGERIRDERTGQVHSYLDRRDIAYKEAIVPSEFAGNAAIVWTQHRSRLWNAMALPLREPSRRANAGAAACPWSDPSKSPCLADPILPLDCAHFLGRL